MRGNVSCEGADYASVLFVYIYRSFLPLSDMIMYVCRWTGLSFIAAAQEATCKGGHNMELTSTPGDTVMRNLDDFIKPAHNVHVGSLLDL